MDSAIRRGFVTILAGFLLGGAALPAFAGYPLAPANCASLNGGQGTQDGRVVLEAGGTFSISGGPGCGSGTAGHIDGQSHRFTFAGSNFAVNANGSFSSPSLTLPSHMGPGPHRLFTVFNDNSEVVLPILVVGSDTTGGGNENTNSSPTGGGGGGLTSAANRTSGGGGGGGLLPRTGSSILMLILWAMALIATGTALVFAARKRGFEWQPLRIRGRRPQKRDVVRALPAPDIPFIDTTGFVPTKPGVAPAPMPEANLVTEADLLRDRPREDYR
ncbi:MAG TPA: LPXTG cell wall anchor domain-containing protein [Actinomycetota bacterium]|jgi:LPXTG-motif cell wall-anchored protein|nr:LPXTG cell wall anchor domain-containing protein [Actinomycetota bacterium]